MKPIDLALATAARRSQGVKPPELSGESGQSNLAGWEKLMKASPKRVIGWRIPGALLDRADVLVGRMQEQFPGLKVSRTEAIVVALTRGLDSLDIPQEPKADKPEVVMRPEEKKP